MNYQESKKNVAITLFVMAYDASKALEREGCVKVVTGRMGDYACLSVYSKKEELDINGIIDRYEDSIMDDLIKNNTNVNIYNSLEIVSKYITVDTFKKEIMKLMGRN